MIIYNVTLSINPELETEVIDWLKEVHIPDVMSTNLFESYRICKIIEDPVKQSHNSYAVQYELTDWEKFHEYTRNHAERLRNDTKERYGENVLAFRTFLETI